MGIDSRSLVFTSELLKMAYGIEITWCRDQYSRGDGEFNWNGKNFKVEVKRRRFAHNKYKTTLINRDKFDILTRYNHILVIIFDDGVYVFKDLKKAFVRDSMKYGRSTTDFDRGTGGYSLKTELDLNKAIRIDIDETLRQFINE